jgi:hypothetical protein
MSRRPMHPQTRPVRFDSCIRTAPTGGEIRLSRRSDHAAAWRMSAMIATRSGVRGGLLRRVRESRVRLRGSPRGLRVLFVSDVRIYSPRHRDRTTRNSTFSLDLTQTRCLPCFKSTRTPSVPNAAEVVVAVVERNQQRKSVPTVPQPRGQPPSLRRAGSKWPSWTGGHHFLRPAYC